MGFLATMQQIFMEMKVMSFKWLNQLPVAKGTPKGSKSLLAISDTKRRH